MVGLRGRQEWLLFLGALTLVVPVSYAIVHFSTSMLLAPVAAGALAWAVTKPWGSAAVVLPVFLVPNVPERIGLTSGVQLGLLVLALAIGYWFSGAGRPRLSPWLVGVPAATGGLLIVLSASNIYPGDVEAAIGPCLVWTAGAILGGCLAANPVAIVAVGVATAPMAVLALLEIAGFPNPWPDLVHAERFTSLSDQTYGHRAQSTFSHPLIAGAVFAVVFALVAPQPHRFRSVLAPLLAAGALATVTRSAMLGILAAALVLIALAGGQRRRIIGQIIVVAIVGWLSVSQIPQLRTSVINRLTGVRYQKQEVRKLGQQHIGNDWRYRPQTLLFGAGAGTASRELEARGDVNGLSVFDNQYFTAIYDIGLIPLALLLVLLCVAAWRAPPEARRRGLPAVVTALVVIAFTDGLYWVSLGLVVWMSVGLLCASNPSNERNPLRPLFPLRR